MRGPFKFRVALVGEPGTSIAAVKPPFYVAAVFGRKGRVPVKGTIKGFPFRSSLMNMGDGHMMVVNAEMRAGAKCKAGDVVSVVMELDEDERTVEVPTYLQARLDAEPDAATLQAAWNKLSFTHRKEYVREIEGAKREETREGRSATIESRPMKAIVIGAGIGGLTAALALRAVGVEAQVYERSEELREVGAGISLWPNAVKALRQLGMAEALAAASLESPDSALRRWDGKVLAWTRAEELRARFGGGVIALHRAELLALLARALGENEIQLGCDCRQIEEGPDGVRVWFANGESAAGDVVIGADGVRSVVRGWLGHGAPPRYAGYTAWRSVVAHPTAALTPGESWGRGRRFGFLPVGRDRVYWYATQNAPEGGQDAADGARAQLLELFKGWHEPVEALIGAATDASILRHDLYDHDPLGAWGRGRVTLLGDAAHAMTPNLGQGACQAMEDALELARALKAPRAANDAGAALREYESRRIARTTSIVLTSRRVGAMGQLESPVLCALRDLAFGLTPSRVSLKGITPVVGYEGHLGG